MRNQSTSHSLNLVPATGRDLVADASANPLVSRGIADLFKSRAESELTALARGQFKVAFQDPYKNYLESRERLNHRLGLSLHRLYIALYLSKLKQLGHTHKQNSFAATERALAYSKTEKHDKAILEFDEIIRLHPQKAHNYFLRGMEYYAIEDYTKSINDLGQAILLDPEARYYEFRGKALFFKKEFEQAIDEFSQLIRRDPNKANYYCHRGEAWCGKKEIDKGIEDFDEAIRLDPKCGRWYYLRGQAKCCKNELVRGIEDYDAALLVMPDFAQGHVGRGTARLGMGEYDEARKDFEQAILFDPESSDAFGWLGWLLTFCPMEKLRNRNLAIQNATRAFELSGRTNGWELKVLAAVYAQSG